MSQILVNTTQNVNISFELASVGERVLACFLDVFIKLVYSIIWYFIFNLDFVEQIMRTLDGWQVATVMFFVFSPITFYSLYQEFWLGGQTLGKKVLKIKVIKIDGYQASFLDYFMRWAWRIIDVYIMGIVGLLCFVFTKNCQRLGDITAGTGVISLKDSVAIDHTILTNLETQYKPQFPQVVALSDQDVRIIKATFLNAKKTADHVILKQLRNKISEVTSIKSDDLSDIDFIEIIIKDYNYYTQNML